MKKSRRLKKSYKNQHNNKKSRNWVKMINKKLRILQEMMAKNEILF